MSSQSHALLWRKGAYQFGDQELGNIQNQGTDPSNNAINESQNNNETAPQKRKSKPKFTADFLTGDNGLGLIYKEFSTIDFNNMPGKELQNLHKLMNKYKEWMYQLYPLNFDELTKKIETFSGNRLVHNELERLRNRRDGITDIENDNEILNGSNDTTNNNNIINNNNDIINNNNNNNNNNDVIPDIFGDDELFEIDLDNNNSNYNNNNDNNGSHRRILPDFVNTGNNGNNNTNMSQNANRNVVINQRTANSDKNTMDMQMGLDMEMEDIDIETELIGLNPTTQQIEQPPGEDEDALADMLFDEF